MDNFFYLIAIPLILYSIHGMITAFNISNQIEIGISDIKIPKNEADMNEMKNMLIGEIKKKLLPLSFQIMTLAWFIIGTWYSRGTGENIIFSVSLVWFIISSLVSRKIPVIIFIFNMVMVFCLLYLIINHFFI